MSDLETTRKDAPQESKGFDLGSALGMGGPQVPEKVDKAENFKGTVVRLIKYLRPQLVPLISMMIIAAIGTWFAIWVPDILKKVTNALTDSLQYFIDIRLPIQSNGEGNGVLYTYIAPILWTCAILYVLNSLFQLTSGMIAASMSQKVVRLSLIHI